MPTNQDNPPLLHRLRQARSTIIDGYHYANIASHHILGALLKLAIVVYFVFGALFLSLRYAVLPNIDAYKPAIEQMASRALGRQVNAQTMQASWRGLRPHLFLTNVVVRDDAGQPSLVLPKVSATISWASLLVADLRLRQLEISQPDMAIRRDRDGNLHVGGIFVDMGKEGDGRGLDWVLSQEEIVIRDGRLSWQDDKRAAPALALQNVDFALNNEWRRHRFALKATPPASFAQPLDVRADFFHPRFASRISDVRRWKGELYADLRDADLTVWKAYVDYPVELMQGQGSVRAWLHFDDAKVADFSADLSLDNVATRLRRDLQPLDLVRVDGRVSVREDIDRKRNDGTPTFGAHGHEIQLTDFSFTTRDGHVFPKTTLTERYTPAQNGRPEKFEVTAKLLDLHMLANFVERLPLAAGQRELLADLTPRGQVRDFAVQWQGRYPDLAAYRIKGQFSGLSMNPLAPRAARLASAGQPAQAALPAIPGFDNLTGTVDANDQGGSFLLQSSDLRLNLPGYFSEPVLPFEKLHMQANWSFQKNDQLLLQIDRMDFVQDGMAGAFAGKHLMPLKARTGTPLGQIDLSGKITELALNKVGRYLPLQTPEHTRTWLAGALEDGKAQNVTVRVKGNLADFPFAVAPGGKPRGEFNVSGKIVGGRLNYDPGYYAPDGKSPVWPLLDKIDGHIVFNRTRMEIRADTAHTGNVALSNVKAVIPDLLSDHPMLDIDGHAQGALQDFLRYTVASPVAGWIGDLTTESKGSGNATLALQLKLPLDRLQDAKVHGSLQFAGNDITLFPEMPTLFGATGKLDFTESGIDMPAVRANFLGGPVTLTGSTQRDGAITIKAAGGLTADGLRKAYAMPAMQGIGQRISGATRYTAAINVKKGGRPEIVIDSSLQGIGLAFPAPLYKPAQDAMPLRLELTGKPVDGAALRDEIRLSLGSAIAVYYEREKSAERDASWRVLRGGVGINVPAPQPDSGVIANVSLRSLNIDEWGKAVAAIVGPAKTGADAASANAINIAQYIEPEVLAARTTELIVAGKKLDNVVVGASHQKGLWQANIDSEQASGYVTWNEAPSGQGLGKVTARLASLVIPKSAASDVSDLLEGKQASAQIPALDITAENFELFGKRFGHLELIANNVGVGLDTPRAAREWQINKLSIVNADAAFNASGKWLSREGESKSSLTYVLDILDAGRLLDRFGFNDVLRGGKGRMQGDLNWNGLPFALDIPSLSGQLALNLGQGQFLKVDPSAAKLLGVLSLQSLPRRLTLDFRDVFSEGYAFDGVVGSATIAGGIAKTDNFKMRSISATVLMDGSADINRETTDLHVAIIPEINAGAASIVYGLAVNPVIGVGTFLAQLFLREPLMKAFTFEYRIDGSWKDPAITKLNRKGEPVPAQNAAPSTPLNPHMVN